jgi:hypothetical protein
VVVTRAAFAQLTRVDAKVLSGGNNALLLNDGGTVRARDGSFVSQSNTSFDNAAIGLFRQASLRMDGNPRIENNNALGGGDPGSQIAIQVAHTSNFRLNNDVSFIKGSVLVGNNSAARIRRLGGPGVGPGLLDGSLVVSGDSSLELGTRSSATVTGFVSVEDQSLLSTGGSGPGSVTVDSVEDQSLLSTGGSGPGSVTVDGGVQCTGPNLDGGIINPDALSPFPAGSGCSLF